MTIIRNNAQGTVSISPGLEVPGKGGTLEIPDEDFERIRQGAVVEFWLNQRTLEVVGADEEGEDTPLSREEQVAQVMRHLPRTEGNFTLAGKPDVNAVNRGLPEGVDPISAEERDTIWEMIQEDGD